MANSGPQLVHNVYFTLKEPSEAARKQLLDSCRKYLTSHPGTVYFGCGVLAEELKREVNDRSFHVGLHIVFESQAAHDAYQVSPRHEQFVRENKESWKQVRVFDSLVG